MESVVDETEKEAGADVATEQARLGASQQGVTTVTPKFSVVNT